MWEGKSLMTSWVVAWGRQQKAASMSSHETSPMVVRAGTLVAAMRCGKTSENCLPAWLEPVRAVTLKVGWR